MHVVGLSIDFEQLDEGDVFLDSETCVEVLVDLEIETLLFSEMCVDFLVDFEYEVLLSADFETE